MVKLNYCFSAALKSLDLDIQKAYHDTLTASGHSYMAKTLTKICAKYHWPTNEIIKDTKKIATDVR